MLLQVTVYICKYFGNQFKSISEHYKITPRKSIETPIKFSQGSSNPIPFKYATSWTTGVKATQRPHKRSATEILNLMSWQLRVFNVDFPTPSCCCGGAESLPRRTDAVADLTCPSFALVGQSWPLDGKDRPSGTTNCQVITSCPLCPRLVSISHPPLPIFNIGSLCRLRVGYLPFTLDAIAFHSWKVINTLFSDMGITALIFLDISCRLSGHNN